MSGHVFVISEWLPKQGQEAKLYHLLKELMSTTLRNEVGCISARATKQISHPGSPGKSKYTIVLMQEYIDIKAFDVHCSAEYVKDFVKTNIEDSDTATIEDGTCRLFREED